ncbi:MAG: methionine biosynthesis protein MetW [Euryarchaeota archaeon RBG_16_68_13]|nr:MAG: methionine biosynthesis protein MetW [Euryarchaeota archaeon RBG_16_68_13]
MDLGCGDGELLARLVKERRVKAEGIDINEQSIHRCVAKGLSVLHRDIDKGLVEYPDESFDYVILNQSLQQVAHLETVLTDALRVGKKVIVGFPNFTHYKARLQIFFGGSTPVTPSLPYNWYDTPNLHFLSISDFVEYCREKRIRIEKTAYFSNGKAVGFFPNLFALVGLFLISKRELRD